MSRHRDGGARRGEARALPVPLPELARALRRARTRQGLRLEDVSARTGLPLEQLQVLEIGTVERIPDRVAILRTLRRYADHLGLPGDRFVLAMVDQWPTTIDRATSVVAVQPSTGAPAVAPNSPPAPAGTATAEPLDTGVVPTASSTTPHRPATSSPMVAARVGSSPTSPGGAGLGAADFDPAARPGVPGSSTTRSHPIAATTPADTRVVPAYQPPATGGTGRRHPRTPLGLRVLVAFAALAVLAGVGGLLVHHYEPQWLRDLGITHAPPHSAVQGNTGGSPTSQTTTQPSFAVASTTANSATLAVRSLSFTVGVTAVNGPSWIQGTAAGNTTPTFAGVLPPNGTHTFSAQHSFVILVGSVAAHLSISVQGKTVGTYLPSAAPFTVTVQTVP